MVSKVFSCTFTGLDCQIIEVQADISNGLSAFNIVGMGDTSVQEAKERVRASIKNSEAKFPYTRKTINLAPAQIRKQGACFDLPIAVSILIASEQLPPERLEKSIIIGELSLTGKVNAITGALAIAQHAKSQGFQKIFLPRENAREASFIEGIEIFPTSSLKQIINYAFGQSLPTYPHTEIFQRKEMSYSAMDHIIGLEKAKRALAIAAAGGHNVLLSGSPGCGKTLLCRAFKSLLPAMSAKEILETTKIFSVAGRLNQTTPLIITRPFREIHHTTTPLAIIGGGSPPKPGEISLAHNGVLFLDEVAEFPRKALEALRQPLEDRKIVITRKNHSITFPTNFILLATMNPCPCGFKDDDKIKCICPEGTIRQYQKRLSGPIRDRFDITLKIHKSPMKKIFQTSNEASAKDINESIATARTAQGLRFKDHANLSQNSDMNLRHIRQFCHITTEAKQILDESTTFHNLSNRAYLKIIKVARTIADLEESEKITPDHIVEAVNYRC